MFHLLVVLSGLGSVLFALIRLIYIYIVLQVHLKEPYHKDLLLFASLRAIKDGSRTPFFSNILWYIHKKNA